MRELQPDDRVFVMWYDIEVTGIVIGIDGDLITVLVDANCNTTLEPLKLRVIRSRVRHE